MKVLSTSSLANQINARLVGNDRPINGIFNILGDAKEGDVVIRHWVDETGIKIAAKKGVSCFITQNPKGEAIKTAEDLNIPLIIIEKIEIANAFALKWTIETFAKNSKRLVITGTNGKSTTTHIIYTILKEAGFVVYTNTDSKSEFNTLIDPIVSKNISDFAIELSKSNKEIDYLVIEVSEVQGWLDKVMKDHALLMTDSINPDVVVITNVAMDHIGLVNSLEEAFLEISGAVKALKNGFAVLNAEDPRVMQMKQFLNSEDAFFDYGENTDLEFREDGNKKGIFYKNEILIEKEKLPFTSPHFIQNTLAAISACICLEIHLDVIKDGIQNYMPLKRRFSIINTSPTIIDDFAHNPDGIVATIKSSAILTSRKLWVVCAIRGSRGNEINLINSQAVVDALKSIDDLEMGLVITNSAEVVDQNNIVKKHEEEVFLNTLRDSNVPFTFCNELEGALKQVISLADKDDTILLIGAQGMDPAKEVLDTIKKI